MPAIPTVVHRVAAYYRRRRLPAAPAESKRSATLVMALARATPGARASSRPSSTPSPIATSSPLSCPSEADGRLGRTVRRHPQGRRRNGNHGSPLRSNRAFDDARDHHAAADRHRTPRRTHLHPPALDQAEVAGAVLTVTTERRLIARKYCRLLSTGTPGGDVESLRRDASDVRALSTSGAEAVASHKHRRPIGGD